MCTDYYCPIVKRCCYCVTDLRTAAAIIAVLAIVTSPVVSWALVKHSYVIRVSCYINTNGNKPDVVDINLNNVLSFGFGANAGLGPSCLARASNASTLMFEMLSSAPLSSYVSTVKYIGFLVFFVDIILLVLSFVFLAAIFMGTHKRRIKITKIFICVVITAMILSFIYGMLFVIICLAQGGSFPLFEFVFTLVDLFVWTIWVYFIIILRSFIIEIERKQQDTIQEYSYFWAAYQTVSEIIRRSIEAMESSGSPTEFLRTRQNNLDGL